MPTPSLLQRLGQLVRGARTLHPTRYTAPGQWRPTPASSTALVLGLWVFGTGEALILASGLGATPWTVLAEGVSLRTGLTIGWTTLAVSTVVLVLWIPLRQRPGLGTILNILVIALALGVTYPLLRTPSAFILQLGFVLLGIALIGLGSAVYLTTGHGPGPRDGWMTGLHRVTGWPIGVVRLAIEVSVVAMGWLLGGTLGLGTVLFALLIGQAIAINLSLVHRVFGDGSDVSLAGDPAHPTDDEGFPRVDDHDWGE